MTHNSNSTHPKTHTMRARAQKVCLLVCAKRRAASMLSIITFTCVSVYNTDHLRYGDVAARAELS